MIPRLVNVSLGLWLMLAPGVLGLTGPARLNDYVIGPLIIGFATVAIWEVMRGLRWVTFLLGIWLILAPFVLNYPFPLAMGNDVLTGLAVAVASTRGGRVTGAYAGGWSALGRRDEILSVS